MNSNWKIIWIIDASKKLKNVSGEYVTIHCGIITTSDYYDTVPKDLVNCLGSVMMIITNFLINIWAHKFSFCSKGNHKNMMKNCHNNQVNNFDRWEDTMLYEMFSLFWSKTFGGTKIQFNFLWVANIIIRLETNISSESSECIKLWNVFLLHQFLLQLIILMLLILKESVF